MQAPEDARGFLCYGSALGLEMWEFCRQDSSLSLKLRLLDFVDDSVAYIQFKLVWRRSHYISGKRLKLPISPAKTMRYLYLHSISPNSAAYVRYYTRTHLYEHEAIHPIIFIKFRADSLFPYNLLFPKRNFYFMKSRKYLQIIRSAHIPKIYCY